MSQENGDIYSGRRRFLALLAGCGAMRAFPVRAGDAKPVRLLFAGSSSTYFNDLPGEVAKVVDRRFAGRPGAPVTAEIAGRSGSDIRVYSEPGFTNYQYGVKQGQTFLEKIRDERFDRVVLQVVAGFMLGAGDPQMRGGAAHSEAVTRYCEAARAAGGEPVFYEMGWGKDERTAEGRKRILDLAVKNRVRDFAPCATAWARVYRERPDLKLQHPKDGTHPGDLGHFVNLACFYAAFTHASPEGKLPREFHVWPHLPKEEKEARKAELDAAYARFKPDAYQEKLPEWMRRNSGAGLIATVDGTTARFLERTAWETWREIQRRLG